VRSSINRKLTLMVMLTTGASLLLACLAFVAYDVVTLRRAMARNVTTLAEVIGIDAAHALAFDDPEAAAESLAALSAVESVLLAVIYDREGSPFASFTPPGARRENAPPLPSEPGHRFEERHLELSRPIVLEGEGLGTIYIRADTAELATRVESYLGIIALLLAAASLVAVSISSSLRRQISRPLADLAEGSEAIAAGDLSTQVAVSKEDEIGILGHSFNGMAAGLRGLVVQVRRGIHDVSEVSQSLRESGGRMAVEAQRQHEAIASSAQSLEKVGRSIHEVGDNVAALAASSQETSAATREMDASIGEVASHTEGLSDSMGTTSAAVAQVTGNIDQVVEGVQNLQTATESAVECLAQLSLSVDRVSTNAAESHALSEDSTQEASRGMASVHETITAMGEISHDFGVLSASVSRLSEKSQSIDEIIQVIQGVAEQTGVLSLNAAIIAAQAGEHGRAFSVVTEQVKNLADRTRSATDEIAQLIRAVQEETASAVRAVETGSEKVERGVQQSNEAGGVLGRIIEKAERSTARVREISDATGVQSADLARLEQAMEHVKEMVERIDRSTRDQQKATADIADAVQRMRALGDGVRRSTDEQRRESARITNAVTQIASMADQIADATRSQSRSSETIQHSLQVFRDVTGETTRRAEALNEMVATLSERSEQLEREIDRFKTE
jgi:methyl-accepting chemotaxis protein